MHHKFLILGILVFLPSLVQADVWTIDPNHSSAQFKIRHLMVSNVKGEIGGLKGTFNWEDKDVSRSKVEASLDPATVSTNNVKRDTHLKSPDFFDVAKYKSMEFRSTRVTKKDGDRFEIEGNLTMHGVTKPVTLEVASLTGPVKSPFGDVRRGLSGTTRVHRKDFGLTWNKNLDGGGVVVGDDVDITLELELVGAKKA